MKADELRKKPLAELRSELEELLHEQFKQRMKHGSGQLPQTHLIGRMRRNVARVRTILAEKISNGEEK